MTQVVHKVLLRSDEQIGNRLPPRHLGYFLAEIPIAVEQSISMALRTRSSIPGRRPQWLNRAADIRLVDHEGDDEPVLYFEAPRLGDSAPEIYQQTEIWPTRPAPDDTGFDLLGDVLGDVAANNADSDHFDPSLLRRLLRFRKALTGPFKEIDISSRRYDERHPAQISPPVIERAEAFLDKTPSPNRVRIVGKLDMIRASTQSFALRLDTGEEVRGVLPEGSVEIVKSLLDRRVLVLGKAVYRASGRLLRVDADGVTAGENERAMWSKLPRAGSGKIDVSRLHKPQGPRSGMAAIMGRWPGEETDAQVEAALEQLS